MKPQLSSAPEGPIEFPKLASLKLDGIRAITADYRVLSRSLKPIPNLYIQKVLSPYQGLDGELIVGPPNAPDVYRTTNSAVMSIEGEPNFTYYVFDMPNHAGTLAQRLQALRLHATSLPPFIKVLDQTWLHQESELDDFYASSLADGYEGLILRNGNSLYKHGRCTAKSQDSLKLKPQADYDAIILSTYEAQTNLNEAFTNELGRTSRSSHQENKVGNGMLGGFVVRDLETGVEFNCAPGTLTHDERIDLWGRDLVGKILKYRCLTIGTKDKPRHPRFIGWRNNIDL